MSISDDLKDKAHDLFWSNDFPKKKKDERTVFKYKDDDGYWRISISAKLFDTIEALDKAYPEYYA